MPIIQEIADLLNLDTDPKLFFEPFLIDENTLVARFAKLSDATMIKIRIEEEPLLRGMIVLWSGTLLDIPFGYALCNGSNGTPDLRDKFVVGAPDSDDPGGVGGAVNHNHTFTGDGHIHTLIGGADIASGSGFEPSVTAQPATGTTDNEDGRPPFYEIAFIMKL